MAKKRRTCTPEFKTEAVKSQGGAGPQMPPFSREAPPRADASARQSLAAKQDNLRL
jgi:hypothetical protein